MRFGARIIVGFVACGVLAGASGAVHPSYAETPRQAVAPARLLVPAITTLSQRIRTDRRLHVAGTLTNPGQVDWLDAQVYLQISASPATTLQGLNTFAKADDATGLGTTIYTLGLFDQVGDVGPGEASTFDLSVPYSALPISGAAGIYRVGVKVVAGTSAGRDPADASHTSTLIPLLPSDRSSIVPVQTVTLLPVSAPVKRLLDGAFADDSLATSISFDGRLYDLLAWALNAKPDTVQVVVDPALLTAVTDMSHRYRVLAADPSKGTVPGRGESAAVTWLLNFNTLVTRQHVMLLPWGVPAGNSLLANDIPGPLVSAVRATAGYLAGNPFGTAVAGWLTEGRTGLRALGVLHHAGTNVQIVAQSSLPGLSSDHQPARALPSLVDVPIQHQQIPVLVTATTLAGLPTTLATSALQFRQRLVADAMVRSMSGDTRQIRVTALPFRWDPGPTTVSEGLASAFALPVVVPQSAIGAVDQTPRPYNGPVRPGPGSLPGLSPDVVSAIRALHLAGGNLAAILLPAAPAKSSYEHAYAMAGSNQWVAFPLTGADLINRQAAFARADLAKVTVTGPPFVAMSSASGRFPLTVTNGLDQAINVRLAVTPEDPALDIGPLPLIQLPADQRRDIQVVSTAEGSGVTSVRARLATPAGAQFGKPWRFDVRATQIGLVIWVVMGVGGAVLFIAAGYRIVNRLRGRGPPRRQVPT